MSTPSLNQVVHHLRRAALLREGGGLTDGQLLDRFLTSREEAAFATLVRRHGPMVLGVCRRVLGDPHDAEDAFQATFLVLVRRADAVVPRDRVGPWLYGVAYRTALEARGARARRRVREGKLPPRPGPRDVPDEAALRERLQLLDRELARLPERYRAPVVLCDLEGKTQREAARILGCPEATVSTRLLRARALLARRLSGWGLACAVGAPAVLSPSLVNATTQAAGGAARVAALVEGVHKAMVLQRLKVLVVGVALLVPLAFGVGLLSRSALAGRAVPPAAVSRKQAPEPKGQTPEQGETLRHLATLKWNLLRIDVKTRTLHVADVPVERTWGRHAAEELFASAGAQISVQSLPVAPDARVTLDGKEVALRDLFAGLNLSLTFAANRPVVTAIAATTPPRAGYVVKEVDAGKGTVVVTRGPEGKPLTVPVAGDALLIGIATLKDLKPGMHVALHLVVEGGRCVVKDLRAR